MQDRAWWCAAKATRFAATSTWAPATTTAVTARLYTDLGLFTCDEQIGADATDLFNYLTGYSAKTDFRKLLVAPVNLRHRLEALIRREIEHAERGGRRHLIFKMNALEDPEMIRLLYEASQAGVRMELLVRGICCLRPGVPGVSENIGVTSIVGRFLEHSRIYYFRNGGQRRDLPGQRGPDAAQSRTAAWKCCFRWTTNGCLTRLRDEILATYLADNRNARLMHPDGTFVWDRTAEPAMDSQGMFLNSSRLCC